MLERRTRARRTLAMAFVNVMMLSLLAAATGCDRNNPAYRSADARPRDGLVRDAGADGDGRRGDGRDAPPDLLGGGDARDGAVDRAGAEAGMDADAGDSREAGDAATTDTTADLPSDMGPGDVPVDQPAGDAPVDQSPGDAPVDQPPADATPDRPDSAADSSADAACVEEAMSTTCAGKCGLVQNNCGHPVSCGTAQCVAPATCGGNAGKPNQCGCAPIASTCGMRQCGQVVDACGNTVVCGTCPPASNALLTCCNSAGRCVQPASCAL